MNLTFNKENFDFWQFYMDNYEELETIIWKFCWKYKDMYDPNDIHSEILLRLHRSHFHEDYKPELSNINTYLTNIIRGYAATIANNHRNKENFYMKIKENQEEKRCFHNQFFIEDINGMKKADIAHKSTIPEELQINPDFDNQILIDELISLVRSKVPEREKKIVDFLSLGYSRKDIAHTFKVTVQAVSNHCQSIKDTFKRTCKLEGITFGSKK